MVTIKFAFYKSMEDRNTHDLKKAISITEPVQLQYREDFFKAYSEKENEAGPGNIGIFDLDDNPLTYRQVRDSLKFKPE